MHGGQQIMNINAQAQAHYEQEKAQRVAKETKAKRTNQTVDIGQAKGVPVVK